MSRTTVLERILTRRLLLPISAALLLGLLLATAAFAEVKLKDLPPDLPAQHVTWLKQVSYLMSQEELDLFLSLEEDYQREAFVQRFWRQRDTDPKTVRNEFRDRWEELVATIARDFDGGLDDRARILMANGPPLAVIQGRCSQLIWPLEIWYYRGSDRVAFEFLTVFFRRWGAGPYRIWHPADGVEALFDPTAGSAKTLSAISNSCPDGDRIAGGIAGVLREGVSGYSSLLGRITRPPEPPKAEWVSTFAAYSTQIPKAAKTFDASLSVSYPGSRQSRTALQGIIEVGKKELGIAELAGSRSYNLILNGELVHQGVLFETFRYKFDLPADTIAGDKLPLIFERFLRPGTFDLVLRVEDLNGRSFFRSESSLEIPLVETNLPPPPPTDEATAALLSEANAFLSLGETTLQLVEPRGDLLSGLVRFDTLTSGSDIEQVTFSLDGTNVLTKRRPPYSVELDLGNLPRLHRLRATAFDAEGGELAADEILLNAGGTRFRIHLTEPRRGIKYRSSLRAEMELSVPQGDIVDRVELFLNENRVATLYAEPWSQPILLPKDAASADGSTITYVRAVAYLKDGNSTEDAVFINAPDYLEEVDVQFIELFTTVLDRQQRPVDGLRREQFQVLENGVPQEIVRFEKVEELPIHAGILLDISASMDSNLDDARRAALSFFEQTLEPKDRAALITFNDRPNLAVKFTKDLAALGGGLAGLKAERGTALYDSLIYSLYYFNGIKGQRALLLLSDGKDESSRFGFEDALDFARRAGVTLYTIGLELPKGDPRRKLTRLAEETGGRSFFVDDAKELEAIYRLIEDELRSQYLIAYQSSNPDASGAFRPIDLELDRSDLEVKTITGYYP